MSTVGPLRRLLSVCPLRVLARAWMSYTPMGRLTLFRLLSPRRAEGLCRLLPPGERYFLYCGLEPGALGPVLESLPAAERRLLRTFPRAARERIRGLAQAGLVGASR